QVLLDLHGAPGGESADAPCGRHQPPGPGGWSWRSWRFGESLRALQVLAKRYRSSSAVTGIEVCNEPSNSVPADVLCRFYSRAVQVVRKAGMPADRVTVVLPLFQRSAKGFLPAWEEASGGAHSNVCFDLHYYHCFGNDWNGKTFAQQLRAVQHNAQELRGLPAVVGEWSLALGLAAERGRLPKDQLRSRFGAAQLEAYESASHGWFFWNWCDAHGAEWNWQQSFKEGWVSSSVQKLPQLAARRASCPAPFVPSSLQKLQGGPRARLQDLAAELQGGCSLPSWDGVGDDPLEEYTDPWPVDPTVRFGDAVFLRTYHGRYIDLGGPKECASARWADRGVWQRFTVWPPVDGDVFGLLRRRTAVQHGDVVRLLAHTGHFLGTDGGKVAECPDIFSDASAEFVVHVEGSGALQHRRAVFLESRANACVVDVDGNGSARDVSARWKDFGKWQRLAVEKVLDTEDPVARAKTAAAAEAAKNAAAQAAAQSAPTSAVPELPQSRKRKARAVRSPSPSKVRRSGSPSSLVSVPSQLGPLRTPEKLSLCHRRPAAQRAGRAAQHRQPRASSCAGHSRKVAARRVSSRGCSVRGRRVPMGNASGAIIPVWQFAGA
ncbi:unnamed protein product, partial [Prorocentrum cordatum]